MSKASNTYELDIIQQAQSQDGTFESQPNLELSLPLPNATQHKGKQKATESNKEGVKSTYSRL